MGLTVFFLLFKIYRLKMHIECSMKCFKEYYLVNLLLLLQIFGSSKSMLTPKEVANFTFFWTFHNLHTLKLNKRLHRDKIILYLNQLLFVFPTLLSRFSVALLAKQIQCCLVGFQEYTTDKRKKNCGAIEKSFYLQIIKTFS